MSTEEKNATAGGDKTLIQSAGRLGSAGFWNWMIPGILCAICIVVYWRVVTFQFVPFDDYVEIVGNPHIRGLGWEQIKWMLTDTSQTEHYTPLAFVIWGVLNEICGLGATALHVWSLLLHLVNTVLVYFVLKSFVRRAFADGGAGFPRDVICAGVGTLLWCLHPLRVEVVAWVAQVRFAESTIFILVTLLLYFAAVDRSAVAPYRSRYYWFSVASFSVAMLLYAHGIGLLVILPLLDVLPLRRITPRSLNWRNGIWLIWEKAPFVVPAAFVAFMTIYGRLHASVMSGRGFSAGALNGFPQFMQAIFVFIYYLWKPFAPFHISPTYTYLIHFDPASFPFVFCLTIFVLLSVAAILLWKRYPLFTLFWIAHVALVLPFGGYFEKEHYPSDRYSYLQGVWWSLLLVLLLAWLWPRVTVRILGAMLALAGVLALVFAMFSSLEDRAWFDGESLFEHILAELGTDPYRATIDWRLGRYYLENGHPLDSIEPFDESLAIQPKDANVLLSKGMALLQIAGAEGVGADRNTLFLRAAACFDEAEAVSHDGVSLKWAGYAFAMVGKMDSAEDRLGRAVEKDAADGQTRVFLADIYHQDKKDELAIKELDEAVRLDPTLGGTREQMVKSWAATSAPAAIGH